MQPEQVLEIAQSEPENIGIAYTYNEPVVWYEFMKEITVEARQNGLKNVMVTNGFINPDPLEGIIELMDAFSVDLKSFTEGFYEKVTGSHIEPVKRTLKRIANSGKHLEVTNLVIPGMNDDEKTFTDMAKWIADDLGRETVLHISRYYPTYKMDIESTPPSTLLALYNIACKYLDYVYIGNVHTVAGRDTKCPSCGNLTIVRNGYRTDITGLDSTGACTHCGKQIAMLQ
jgi:pyruvate formate lyase activating enzyme